MDDTPHLSRIKANQVMTILIKSFLRHQTCIETSRSYNQLPEPSAGVQNFKIEYLNELNGAKNNLQEVLLSLMIVHIPVFF